MPNVKFNLDEDNDIQFKLAIRGSSTGLGNTTPIIRLIVSEKYGPRAMVFQGRARENGYVGVTIPSLSGIFAENNEYVGKLEIIVGNRYFSPTTIGMEFTRSLQVEAVVDSVTGTILNETPPSTPFSSSSVINTALPPGVAESVAAAEAPVVEVVKEEKGSQIYFSTTKPGIEIGKRMWR